MWPGGTGVVGEHLARSGECGVGPRQDEGRVEVALDDEVVAEAAAGVGDGRAPVEPEHGRTGRVHRLEEMVATDAEVDRGSVRVAGAEFVEHPSGMWQHVPVVVAAAERTGPRVEQLEGAGAVAELGVDERDGRFAEPVHQVVPQALVAVDQRLGVAVVAARPALDQVAGDGERRSGEGEERHVGWQFRGEQADRVDDVVDVVDGERAEAVEIGAGAQRLLGDGTGAGRDVDPEPHGVRGDDDVAEQHGRVDAVPPDRLQRDLRRNVGALDGVEDRALTAHRPVLGQRSSGLAHEPHGRATRPQPPRRVEEGSRPGLASGSGPGLGSGRDTHRASDVTGDERTVRLSARSLMAT